MVGHRHHKIFIGVSAVAILIIGLFLGYLLASNLETVDLEIVNIGLTFTNVILLLLVGGLIIEIKDAIQSQSRRKR